MFSLVVLRFSAAELSGWVARARRPDARNKCGWHLRSVVRVSSAQYNCTGHAGAYRPRFRLRGARQRHLCQHPGTAGGDG
jgi:hypothetical protein